MLDQPFSNNNEFKILPTGSELTNHTSSSRWETPSCDPLVRWYSSPQRTTYLALVMAWRGLPSISKLFSILHNKGNLAWCSRQQLSKPNPTQPNKKFLLSVHHKCPQEQLCAISDQLEHFPAKNSDFPAKLGLHKLRWRDKFWPKNGRKTVKN